MKNNRQSNMELLRIISMLLIVIHHYAVHTGFPITESGITFNKVFVQILSMGGKIGVNIFVLISGYFLIKSEFKVKKLVKLLLEIFFYSFVIGILFFLNGERDYKMLLKSCLPTISSLYWFATTYVLMYILSPYVNILIQNLKQKNFEKLIGTLMIVQVIIPTFTTRNFGFNNLTWFITLYLVGAYIQIYGFKFINTKKKANLILGGCCIFLIGETLIFDVLGLKYNFFNGRYSYFLRINSLPVVISAIAIFYKFQNKNIQYNKCINFVSSSTFGIYLIHDNYFMREFIWQDILPSMQWYSSIYFFAYSMICIIGVFVVCMLIDKMRELLFEKILSKVHITIKGVDII